jgi:hypothetical protein
MEKLSIKYILAQFFIVATFFPWVSFRTNSMDSQPWAFLLASCYIFFFNHRILNKNMFLVFLAPIFSLIVSCFYYDGDSFLIIRVLLSYVFFSTIFFACYLYYEQYGIPLKILISINLIYVFFGVWQIVIGDGLVNYIAPIRTTEGRGVTSLAVEPTNFGIALLIFSWLYLIYTDYKPNKLLWFLIILNLVSIMILAQSSMTILFLLIAVSLITLYRISLIYLILILLSVYFAGTAVMEYFPDIRVAKILNLISNVGIGDLIFKDASINVRVSSAIFPYEGLIENLFLPGGATSFQSIAQILKENYSGYFWYGGHAKIMSYIGSFVYQLGFFGVFLCAYYFVAIQNGRLRRVFESFFLFLLLNSALSVALPIVAFLLITMLYSKKSARIKSFG